MYVRFKEDFLNHKSGEISGDIPSNVARSFIEAGKAEEVNSEVYLRGLLEARLDQRQTELLKTMQDMLHTAFKGGDGARAATQPTPPNGGGQVDFDAVARGAANAAGVAMDDDKDPAIRANNILLRRIGDAQKRGQDAGIGEILGLVGIVGKPQAFDPAKVHFANRRLQHMCGEFREEVFNANSGRWDTKHTRTLADGALEVITRTGTDSLSGGTTYGFALKPEFLGNLFEISMEQQVFVNAATQIPVSNGIEVRWPAWDQYRPPTLAQGVIQPAVFAGVQLYYEGETSPRVSTDANLNSINFKIIDLTAFTALSRDFVVDNYLAFDAALTRMIGRAFGWMEDWMSIQGPGVGRPQGYFNSGATLVVNRASSTYKISSNDLTAMIAAVSPMVWNELRWITNITTVPYLAILTNSSGTPVFQPNALITQAQQFSIMDKSMGGSGAELMHRPMGTLVGFPVYFSEKVSQVGNTGDLSLVAPSQYGVARRSGLEIAVSEHFYFSTDLIAYRMKQRHDMKSLWRAPYIQADNPSSPASGTQVSPFVMLH